MKFWYRAIQAKPSSKFSNGLFISLSLRSHCIVDSRLASQDELSYVSGQISQRSLPSSDSPSLDTIGIAGFGHDFGALRGHKSSVLSSLEAFSNQQPSGVPLFLHFLIYYLPIIHHLPMARNANMVRLSESLEKIFEELLSKKKAESEGSTLGSQGDISAIGALGKASAKRRCCVLTLTVHQ